ncbi:Cytoplasmic glyoxalase II [Coemansia javaensis]|uniref:hydroxyacylglutathione hydrolase n=1 Tax=Coemansia javaensis TaxID=2761396 RepID=A0A9W8LME4_9FUNG|nr:Cytoplasmic glyoxalase II [Coemansia javaensis]
MKIIPVPCLSDNYAYVLVDDATQTVAVVDPVEPGKVLAAAAREAGAAPGAVLTTHHHADHAAGNARVAALVPGVAVYGGDERIPAMTRRLAHGDEFAVGALQVRALSTHGHTTSSISYYVQDAASGQRAVFTGDTLFVGGCGRLFEGSPGDMHKSLNETLAALPGDTLVYAGHEYTAANLRFALSVDADNAALRDKAQRCATQTCTMPSTIAEELATNPFMRVDQPALQRAAGATDPVAVLGAIRRLKDNF